MTIIVNDALMTTRILCTVSELDAVTSNCVLKVFNPYTNVSTQYNLPDDSSPYPDRYNEFLVPTSAFSGLSSGVYDFKILDSNSGTTETGLLRVVSSIQTPDQEVEEDYIIPADDADEYLVYQPITN